MKKFLYFIMASAATLVVSCGKQEAVQRIEDENIEAPVQNETFTPLVINAIVDEDITKTEYTDDGSKYVFKWSVGDKISVQLYKRSTEPKSVDQLPFTATCSEASATSSFTQDSGTFDLSDGASAGSPYTNTAYVLGDYAFYPRYTLSNLEGLQYSGSGSTVENDWVMLNREVPYFSSKPTSIIPMIGKKVVGSDGTPTADYHFRTATGVLKLTLNNIPAGANKLVLTSLNASDQLSGRWYFNDDTYTNGIIMDVDDYDSYTYNDKTITFSGLDGQNADFYIPIPTGTVHGLKIDVKKDDALLWRVYTDSNIDITRGVVKELTPIDLTGKGLTSFSVTGTSSNPGISITRNGIARFCVDVSSSETIDLSAFPDGLAWDSAKSNPIDYSISTWDATHTMELGDKSSGLFYMHYVALSENVNASSVPSLDDKRVKTYGTVPFYYLNATDASSIVGNYTATQSGVNWWGSSTHDDLVVLENSDNPIEGQVMLTTFRKRSYNLTDGSGTYTADAKTGTPVYGTLSGTTLTFNGADNFSSNKYFFYTNGWSFYIVGGATALDGKTAPTSANADFSFEIGKSEDHTTLTNSGYIDLIFDYQKDSNWYAFWSFQNMILTHE